MIKRKIFSKISEHLSSDQMTILIGPRQVGKTYLMDLLRKNLENKGEKIVWLNLDNDDDEKKFSSQRDLLTYIEYVVGRNKAYVFIDEIQRKENAGLFLKGIFDIHAPYKFIVSGSGSLELKAKIPESMAGRKQLFVVNPVDFEEFVNFKTKYRYEDRLSSFFQIETEQTKRFLSEYLVFGGYPRVILAETASAKDSQMQEIYRSYVDRDIQYLLHLEKTEAFRKLLQIIAAQIGSLVNITELASTIGIDVKTINHYLFYLEQTFIIKKVTPFFRNTRSEITKSPMYYFVDMGFRNWILRLFGLPEIPPPLSGHLFENFVYHILEDRKMFTSNTIHFWRTRDHAEVDFVVQKGIEPIPFEVKYTSLKKPEISRSFRSFLLKYQPQQAYVVHTGEKQVITLDGTTISCIPYYQLPAMEL